MATGFETNSDSIVAEIRDMLKQYEQDYPGSHTDTYRYNSASVRIKIEDPRFVKMSRGDRYDDVWQNYVSNLSEETQSDVSMLLLVAPGEDTFLSAEFAKPTPSRF